MMRPAMLWLMIGFLGQALFTARFLVQWIASERKRDSVMPVAFWWLSLLGGLTLLSYASYRQDPVIMVGQAMGLVVYARNLMLLGKAKRRAARRRRRVPSGTAHEGTVAAGPHWRDRADRARDVLQDEV
ncbi:MAG: lipid-A-disaccharide synthase N-terminal domain-containing protein [Singulisphaera sp.]|nr:lipid-A-disaccharide synthase N-terminal domain-containing protein [Singulisphaera sp.]